MIVLKLKDIDKFDSNKGERRLLVVCNPCASWNFSEKNLKEISEKLNAEVSRQVMVCNYKISGIDSIAYDKIFGLMCGAGIQVLAEILGREVIPIVDTLGIGVKKNSEVEIYCSGCGNCRLEETLSICTVARCAKSLANGPCGGVHDAKCEVDNKECVWISVYEKAKSLDRIDDLLKNQ